MSYVFTLTSGLLLGIMAAKITAIEAGWAILIIPAAASLIVAHCIKQFYENRS